VKQEYISLIAGFFGAILGAAASLISVWLQQRSQERRDRARLVLDAAIKEFESAETYAKWAAEDGRRIITRELGYYIVLQQQLMENLANARYPNKDQWIAAHRKALEISEAVNKFSKENHADQQGDLPDSGDASHHYRNRYRGWIRIGVVLSATWFLGICAVAAYEYFVFPPSDVYLFVASVPGTEADPKNPHIVWHIPSLKVGQFLQVLILPLIVGWILISLIAWAVSWVRVGFQSQ
jgi:hypothetical protein